MRRTALATRRGAPVNSTLGVAIHSVPYRLLADTVLVTHLAFVVFVVGGLVCIFVGNIARVWPWVNSVGFRSAHLGAIGVVVAQAWLGQTCPLTLLESWLRVQSGAAGYGASFIEHWVLWLIYFQAPSWVFTALYTAFALLVFATWVVFPPSRLALKRSDA